MATEVETLHDELRVLQAKRKCATSEGATVIDWFISQVERDIARKQEQNGAIL